LPRTPRRILSSSLALCLAASFAAVLPAQTPPAPPKDDTLEITLGQAAAPLYGPWKFTIGDSPLDPTTNQPLWAQPAFDDSRWETVDLTPKDGAVDPTAGQSGYVPGWTTRGHADYSGYAWYRIRVRCHGGTGSPLALAGPADIDDAYQLFADGKLLGSFGNFAGKQPVIYFTQPLQFALPGSCRNSGLAGTAQTLAFRFWMAPSTLVTQPDSGGMHDAPLLGEAGMIGLHDQSQWLELIRGYAIQPVEAVVFALLAVVAFSLILFDRSDRVYLWIGLLFLTTAVSSAWGAAAVWTQWIPIRLDLVVDPLLGALISALWVVVWWVWFGREGFRWLPGALWALAVLFAVTRIVGLEVFPGIVSHAAALRFYDLSQALRFVFIGLLAWVVIDGIRRKGIDGWLVLPVVLLRGVGSFSVDLVRLHLYHFWFPFGAQVTTGDIAFFLVAAVIALLLLRRLLQSVQRQREMALDVKQAQEVQRVILPEARVTLPGLVIESEYRPAREVGGDFFQILPHDDGSLLIVAGDVTGKGLKAGMLVALMVGAIRTAADTDADPEFVLRALNKRLIGRGDAGATCLALRLDADGNAKLVNAGHIAPYLNGEPVAMEGALPLGMIEGADFSVLRFKVREGDTLLLMSDGVLEATDANGNLFGFERILALVRTKSTAAGIADAAQSFGQDDDISVISVTRAPIPVPAV
jgi:stage II sporulation SpoE-like protein